MQGLSVRVRGTVQGVGFRPFVYQLAERHRLTGWVRNTAGQVEIELDGVEPALAGFLRDLRAEAPPLSRIEELEVHPRAASGFELFEIRASARDRGRGEIAPDSATCEECVRELFDPADRRYRYPFINCTHCGPRFTIIDALPYDRSRTTMRSFEMCEDCRREYEDPRDRRFHAQPVACPRCGPTVWLHAPGRAAPAGDPIDATVSALREGAIVAIKGLGGYHLACDARNADAVSALRARKHRYGKPFAIMVPTESWAETLCHVTPRERESLTSRERPIVLLRRREDEQLAPDVAPGLDSLGIMLPYTPLHHLLLRGFDGPLIMTSGNLSEEPIAIGNAEALERLVGIADLFLLHDRDIYARYDDSVVRVLGDAPVPIRRARGYAPRAFELPFEAQRHILACGAQQKNTFCLVRGAKAYLGQHIGELDDLETLEHFRSSLELYVKLFEFDPQVIAHDLHPDYLSTRFALEHPMAARTAVGVQHHHAHVVSAMAEHGMRGPVIGVAFDGTGYGTDGAVWGGEFLVADWRRFRRAAHLRYVPLLGGEAAIRRPYRMAASYIWALGAEDYRGFFERIAPAELDVLRRQFESELNAPPTSSAGRLFDAVAALLGVRMEALYEGQPAIELEAIADPDVDRAYPFEIGRRHTAMTVDVGCTLDAIWRDHRSGVPASEIAGAFHATVAGLTVATCSAIREEHGLDEVVLSGGCFQNALLTASVMAGLRENGFDVFAHERVPPNDGGLSLGQAVVAHALTTGEGDTESAREAPLGVTTTGGEN